MNKKVWITVMIGLTLVISGFSLAQAQSPAPATLLVCAHQTTGLMEVVATPDDCIDKRILFHIYTQEGSDGQLASIDARLSGIEARLAAAEAENAALRLQVEEQASHLAALEGTVAGMSGQEGRLAALEHLLAHFSRDGDEITVTGANLNIVNGLGSTVTTNSLGNLVIGYNEPLGDVDRSGSHMLVVGTGNNFSSFGGIIAGWQNMTSAPFASISGGSENTASGIFSSVSGGSRSIASGANSSVSGGYRSQAAWTYTSVSGGNGRVVIGMYDWVAGELFQDE